jgi:hypothetical protein
MMMMMMMMMMVMMMKKKKRRRRRSIILEEEKESVMGLTRCIHDGHAAFKSICFQIFRTKAQNHNY